MNKSELVSYIAEQADLKKTEAARALEAFLDGVSVTLKKGGKVQIIGFGTFDVKQRKETKGRNPQTGAEITIPASMQVKFKVGKALKEAVNK